MIGVQLRKRPFWEMVSELRQYEGQRSLWRVPVAGLLLVAVPVAFVAISVLAGYITGDGFDVLTAAISAAVLLVGTGWAIPWFTRQKLHRAIVANRLATWEKANPPTLLPINVRGDDVDEAMRALRRAGFHPRSSTWLTSPPSDATDLDHKIDVEEPEAWPQSESDQDRVARLAAVMSQIGVRARVAGVDVGQAQAASSTT